MEFSVGFWQIWDFSIGNFGILGEILGEFWVEFGKLGNFDTSGNFGNSGIFGKF